MSSFSPYLIIIGSLGSVGLLTGGLGYLISQFREGGAKQKADVVSSADQLSSFWKEQADGYKAMAQQEKEAATIKEKEWNTKFNELSREVGEIKGQLVEKEKQAAQYLEILQNRDPETKRFMELVIGAIDGQSVVNKEIVRVLSEIHSMVSKDLEQDLKITSTVTKQ